MKIGELEVSFEPYELPEDYKFVYKIKGCEHKVDFDTNTIVDKILSTRTKKVDEEVIRQLKNIGEEKGINELILIDESKVLNLVKAVRALEIIKEKRVNVDNFLNHIKKDTDYKEYQRLCGLYKIMVFSDKELTKEEYDLLKEILK